MQAGGMLSIGGDIILTDVDQYGQSLPDFLMGPAVGELNKIVWKGLLGNKNEVITADKDFGDLVQRATSGAVKYIPGQFWYWRLAWDRAVLDGMRKTADPSWARRDRERERKRLKQKGNNERYWK